MKKIIEYNVVPVSEAIILVPEWQPYGSPFVDSGRTIQAMVKYEEEENRIDLIEENLLELTKLTSDIIKKL